MRIPIQNDLDENVDFQMKDEYKREKQPMATNIKQLNFNNHRAQTRLNVGKLKFSKIYLFYFSERISFLTLL